MKGKIKIGEKVYLKPINNAARRSDEILESEIVKVGRKYFEVNKGLVRKYRITDLTEVSDYTPDYKIYFSKQEILEEKEVEELYRNIGTKFSLTAKKDLSLDQLRRIKEIISE